VRPPVIRTDTASPPKSDVQANERGAVDPPKPRRRPAAVAILVGTVGLAVVGAGLAFVFVLGGTGPVTIRPIEPQVIDELESLQLAVAVDGRVDSRENWEFALSDEPEGATIHAKTGEFRWTPTEQQGPGWYELTVQVGEPGSEAPLAQQKFGIEVREVARPPVLEPIGARTVPVGQTMVLQVKASDPDVPAGPIRFRLAPGAPGDARIDPQTGSFRWTPLPTDAGKSYEIAVQAAKDAGGAQRAEQLLKIQVEGGQPLETPRPAISVDRLIRDLRADGLAVVASGEPLPHPRLSGDASVWSVGAERFAVFDYPTPADAQRDATAVTLSNMQDLIDPLKPVPAYLFHREGLVAFYTGGDAQLLNLLDKRLGRPAAVARIGKKPSDKEVSGPTSAGPEGADKLARKDDAVPEKPAPEDTDEAKILEMYLANKLFGKSEYPRLRKIFADRFAREHAEEIRQVFGEPQSEMHRWLAEHGDIKEEFYLAIHPKYDDVQRCLQLFKELKERFPRRFETHANLAIAVAVVWDKDQAIHESPCRQHGSLPPEGPMGALENFRYFVEAEKFMAGRARFLPWEFLAYMVDHRTTLPERRWALANYVPKRVKYGKCYHDVPYDKGMLDGEAPELTGKPHTLQNAELYGGVCSCQADYAARVGKSIGVPAFMAIAPNKYGGNHAWVMWVELGTVTRTGLTFSLESYGRYRGDKYYVGFLRDPHTGRRTTDRGVELRLQTVGADPVAKRHADLIMRSYPMLKERAGMDVARQLMFLNKIIEYSPGNEAAWITLARMSRDGLITKVNSKPMQLALNRLFVTFAKCPDFTWQVFDDMVAFQDVPKQRAALYGRLATMYEQADRADLSCTARLKYTEYLVADERYKDALQVLAAGVMRFPDDGRFVPKLIERMEELAPKVRGADANMVQLYQQLLPRIPKKRLGRPSTYCMEMYERGIARFRQAGLLQLTQLYEIELTNLRAQQNR